MSDLTADVFLTPPTDIEIAKAARGQWEQYVAATDADAKELIIADHVAHIRNIMAFGLNPEIGAVFITDIPNTNLALIDAHFPAIGERFVSVFTRQGATLIARMLSRQLSPRD